VNYDALIAFFERNIPFNAHLGMTVDHIEAGHCVLRIPYADHLIGDPGRPALHGGVVSTLADTAGGLAVFSKFPFNEARVSTVDLRVDYLRPGLPQDVLCEATVVRLGNKVAVTHMVVRQGPDYLAADGRGVYNVLRNEERQA